MANGELFKLKVLELDKCIKYHKLNKENLEKKKEEHIMTITGHLTKNVLTEINNKGVLNREVETNVDSDIDDDNEDNKSDCNYESDRDPTDKMEELITKLVQKDEDYVEDDDSEEIEEYVAQVILPGGSTTRSGRYFKPNVLRDYAYYH